MPAPSNTAHRMTAALTVIVVLELLAGLALAVGLA
jgi:uncharacterized membrane protein YphA (DoxX/SURF4 family)